MTNVNKNHVLMQNVKNGSPKINRGYFGSSIGSKAKEDILDKN